MTNNKSKHKKGIILIVVLVLLAAVVAVAYVPVSSYLAARYAPLDETELPSVSEIAQTAPAADLTDDDINKLISGEASLDALLSGAAGAGTTQAASSQAGSTAASENSAASAGSAQSGSASASSAAAGSAGGTAASGSAGSSGSQSAANSNGQSSTYESEIKELILQLYAVQARAESGLNSCIAEAKAEFHALPEEQQTQTRKIAITFSKAGTLSALQASCDKEVESIVNQMHTVLTENGQSTALADQAMAAYKSQKSARYNELMAKLYS